MEEIFNFIEIHWEIISSSLLVIASLVIYLLKKRPVNGVLCAIHIFALQGVRSAELTSYKGLDKLKYAVNYVYEQLKQTYPEIRVSSYYGYIVDSIENILSTPQKKEEK